MKHFSQSNKQDNIQNSTGGFSAFNPNEGSGYCVEGAGIA